MKGLPQLMMYLALICISCGTLFGVFHVVPERGGAGGQHSASVLHPCL